MSKTPPPLRKPQDEPDEPKSKSTLSKLADGIKQRVSEVQTRPDFSRFKLGEIQTKPDWATRKSKQLATQGDMIEWVRIIPFAGQSYDADKLPSKLGSITGVVHFRFYKDERSQIHIYAGHQSADKLRRALRQRVPDSDLQETDAPPTYDEKFVNRVGELGGTLNEKGNLIAILDALEDETYIDVTFEERPEHEFKKSLRDHVRGGTSGGGKDASTMTAGEAWKELLGFSSSKPPSAKKDGKAPKKELSTEDRDQLKRVESLISESTNYFRVTVRIGAKRQNHIQPICNEINTQMKKQHRLSLAAEEKKKLWKNNSDSPDALWREEELAAIVALPDMTNKTMLRSVTHMKPGEKSLSDDELSEGIAVGRLIHPTKPNRLVKIPTKQFLRHFFMGGKNGSGKSSTAVQMIQSLLDEWGANPNKASGFTYIDPAGSTLTIILNRLLHMEQQGIYIPWEKVHYIDLTPETEYPVGLNLIYHTAAEDPASVAGGALDVIKSVYGSDAIFTERLIENGLMTLLYDDRRTHTILGLTSVLQYPAMREDIDVVDPLVEEFWEVTGDELKPKQLDPLSNRLRPLLQNPTMRRIFGQTRWTLDICKWMDDGHIILVNVLNLEPKNMGLVGGQLLMRYHITAKTRPADISKPHILMIDEAHNVQIPVLEKVIAEDRKFGLSLGLITQFPEQFDSLRKSITENMGTFLTCTVGPDSAGVMNKMMNNSFDNSTLQGLPTSRVAAYTSINGEPFSFMVKSDPPVIYLPNGKLATYESREEMEEAQNWAHAKAKELSSRDGAHRDQVDAEIKDYMDWLKQFRIVEDEDDDEPKAKSKSKKYRPTESEQPILDAIVGMIEDSGEWEGRTSELLASLESYLSEDALNEWTPNALGQLIKKAMSWLNANDVNGENKRKNNGSVWYLEQK